MSTEEFTVISSYTRQEAIADGVLDDVTKLSQEVGFQIPVCITAAVSAECNNTAGAGQSFEGRLWDVLYMAAFNFRAKTDKDRITVYKCAFYQAGPAPEGADYVEEKILWLVFNEYEGFTIMFPEDY